MNRSGVTVVGSFNVDHAWQVDALPVPGETRSGTYLTGPGGKGFNQAVACARAGAATRFVCALGDDAGGQLARALATAEGIDMRDACAPLPTGSAGIFVDAAGRNSIVVAPGANGALAATHVSRELAGASTPAVVLAQLETPLDAALAAFRGSVGARALRVLNPAPANVTLPRALLDLVDVLTPNETEFAALVRDHLDTAVDPGTLASRPDDALHALCRRLLPRGSVVVTLGAAGCAVSHADDARRGDDAAFYRVPAAEVRPVDTTGAGDAFNGALCASLAMRDDAFAAHVRFAGAYASLSTEAAGAAAAMPRLDALVARFPALAPG